MKKKLFDRRGAGIELAVLMTVVSFSVSVLLLSAALLQHTKRIEAEDRLAQSVVLEQLGQDFLDAVLKGDVDENWLPNGYDGFFVTNDKHECIWVLDEDAQNTDANCTEDGSKTYKCTVCGESKTEVIPAGHIWNEGVVKENATCTKEGVVEYTCSCGETLELTSIILHDWQDVTDAPNDEAEDDVEGESGTVEDNAGADGEDEQSTTPSCTVNKKQKCSQCGAERDYVVYEHRWNDGIVSKEPTCTEEGLREFACTYEHEGCLETKTEPISMLPHSWGEDTDCAVCGKERPTGTYTLTVYKTEKDTLKIQVTVPSDADDSEEDDSLAEGEDAESVETIEDTAVLKIVLHYDILTETYKITEWTKNDRS